MCVSVCVCACVCARVCAFLSAKVGSENNFLESVLSVSLYVGFGDQAQVVCVAFAFPHITISPT